jgi:hypothetical protein
MKFTTRNANQLLDNNLFVKTVTKVSKKTDRQQSSAGDSIGWERRLTRLEATQLTGAEVKLLFDRMADQIDMLAEQIDRRFDWLEARCDRLESRCQDLDRQIDLANAKLPDRVSRSND